MTLKRVSLAVDYAILGATLVALNWGFRQPLPQKYLPSRIGLFYLVLWQVASKLQASTRAAWYAALLGRYGVVYYLIISASRYAPNLLRLPASFTGKRANSNGSFSWLARLLNFPYAVFERNFFRYIVDAKLKTGRAGLNPFDKIYDNMYLGVSPWLLGNEIPDEVELVCDVSNEFENTHCAKHYKCFPIWDQGTPEDTEAFLAFVEDVAKFEGPIYFHCAFGVGRSSLMAAAVLLKRGVVKTPQEALALIKKSRPFANWEAGPRAFMELIAPRLTQ